MSFGANISGSVRLTADGPVGPADRPIRVFNATQLSGATAGILVLRNGSTDSGTVYIQKTAPTVSNTDTINFEDGLLFPDGCFFDKDTNTTAVVVEFRVEN